MNRRRLMPLQAAVELRYLGLAEANRSKLTDLSELHEFAVAGTIEAVLGAFRSSRQAAGRRASGNAARSEATELELAVSALVDHADLAETIGATLEQLRGCRLGEDSEGHLSVESSPDQRGNGVYYTPVKLAEEVARPAIEHALRDVFQPSDLANVSIVDPAVGGGVFLLVALRLCVSELSTRKAFSSLSLEQLRATIASQCLYGVDIDPASVATTRALIRAEIGAKGRQGSSLDRHLRVADAVASGIDAWRQWFPDRANGFSVVVTNPPWSKLRPLRHEFFEHMDSRVRMFQGQELGGFLRENIHQLVHGSWEEFANRSVKLSSALRRSPDFPISNASAGDPDLYKYFLELSVAILRPGGVASVLLPSGFLRAQGGAPLRAHLFERGQVVELTEFINKRRIFEIHSMYRFVALVFLKDSKAERAFASFGVTDIEDVHGRSRVELSRSFLSEVGGSDLLIPEVRTDAERDLLQRLFRRGTRKPSIAFKRELDMTNDSDIFIDARTAISQGFAPTTAGYWEAPRTSGRLLPLYEGRMVHQFDHAAKEYRGGQGRSAKWEIPVPGHGKVSPHYFVSEANATERGWKPVERFGYCEVSGHANERTILAAVIPPYAICGNKVPVLRAETVRKDDGYYWLALANSLVIDWIVRRFVSTTVNQFYWRNIPFPTMSEADKAFCVRAARKISSLEASTPSGWLGKRGQLRAAIDALVMKAFDLRAQDRELILNDFSLFGRTSKSNREEMSLDRILAAYSDYAESESPLMREIERLVSASDCAAAYATREQLRYVRPKAAGVHQVEPIS